MAIISRRLITGRSYYCPGSCVPVWILPLTSLAITKSASSAAAAPGRAVDRVGGVFSLYQSCGCSLFVKYRDAESKHCVDWVAGRKFCQGSHGRSLHICLNFLQAGIDDRRSRDQLCEVINLVNGTLASGQAHPPEQGDAMLN
jgi:hypothetical protein